MEDIVSLIVANGIFAVLFCGLLAYELKDSRQREKKYTSAISELTDRLKELGELKRATDGIESGIDEIKNGIEEIKSELEKSDVKPSGSKKTSAKTDAKTRIKNKGGQAICNASTGAAQA